jgi:hypothetical protein
VYGIETHRETLSGLAETAVVFCHRILVAGRHRRRRGGADLTRQRVAGIASELQFQLIDIVQDFGMKTLDHRWIA